MSNSAEKPRVFTLTAQTNDDAELFIIDGSMRVVARGVARLTQKFPAGLYKVKANRGGAIHECFVDLDRARSVTLYIDSFPAIAPIGPLLREHQPAVEALAARARGKKGSIAKRVLILGHQAIADGAGSPLDGLRLFPWRQATGATLLKRDAVTAEIGAERWSAVWLDAEPGTHVLELRAGDRTTRQAVLVAPKWQTRVFVRRMSSDAAQGTGELTIDTSVQMARPGQPVVYFDHLESVEVSRNALAASRPIFVSARLVDLLLYGKFDNPITGMTGLHLFLEALERDRTTAPNQASRRVEIAPAHRKDADKIIDTVLKNLSKLLGGTPEPPDLVALRVRAGRLGSAKRVVVTEPPMFWAGWEALRHGNETGQFAEVDRRLWGSVAYSAPSGPYFAWVKQETTVEKYVARATGVGQWAPQEAGAPKAAAPKAAARAKPKATSARPSRDEMFRLEAMIGGPPPAASAAGPGSSGAAASQARRKPKTISGADLMDTLGMPRSFYEK